nr:hypothetical protein [uncultured Campylobacter sp.]
MHYEILNLAAMSSQTRERLGLKSCARFCAEFCEQNFKCQTHAGFTLNFCVDLARNSMKFRAPSSAHRNPTNPTNPTNQNSTG